MGSYFLKNAAETCSYELKISENIETEEVFSVKHFYISELISIQGAWAPSKVKSINPTQNNPYITIESWDRIPSAVIFLFAKRILNFIWKNSEAFKICHTINAINWVFTHLYSAFYLVLPTPNRLQYFLNYFLNNIVKPRLMMAIFSYLRICQRFALCCYFLDN